MHFALESLFRGRLGTFPGCDIMMVRSRGVSWMWNKRSHEFRRIWGVVMTYAIGLIDDKFDELLADYSWTLKGLRLTAEEVSEGCDFRDGWRPFSLNRLPDGDLVRVCRNGRRIAFVPVEARGRARLGPGVRVGSGRGAGCPRRGRPGWCWRRCCGWWGSIVNKASCYMFARWRSDADFSA